MSQSTNISFKTKKFSSDEETTRNMKQHRINRLLQIQQSLKNEVQEQTNEQTVEEYLSDADTHFKDLQFINKQNNEFSYSQLLGQK